MTDIFKGIRDSASKATFEAARLYRIQQAQAQLSGSQSEKQDKFRDLGAIVWDMFLANQISEPRLLDVCKEVKALEQQIRDTQNRIEAIKQEQPPEPPKCPGCSREVSDADAFCPGCGTAIPKRTSAQPAVAPQQLCPNCSKPVRAGATFCGSCGHRLVV
jgi:hypothetical protein